MIDLDGGKEFRGTVVGGIVMPAECVTRDGEYFVVDASRTRTYSGGVMRAYGLRLRIHQGATGDEVRQIFKDNYLQSTSVVTAAEYEEEVAASRARMEAYLTGDIAAYGASLAAPVTSERRW